MKFKRVIYSTLVLVFVLCLCLAPSTPKTRAQDGGSSRDVIPPTTYITEDQAHARLFTYNNAIFTNISAANQNISPEVNAVAWNGSYWAMAARGRLWRYNGTAVTEVLTPDPVTPAENIYPYAAIASNAGGDWLAGTLTGRGMFYNGTDAPSAYKLANSNLTAEVDGDPLTTTFPVADGTKFKTNDVVQVGTEYCLVESVAGNDLTVMRGYNPTTGGSDPSQSVPHPGWDGDINVRVAFADIVSVDWDGDHGRWIVAGLTPNFSTHLFATLANNTSTDLGLTGVSQARGDYRVGNYSYYLVGGQTNGGTTSKLYSYDNHATLTNITGQIPNMDQSVTVITGGTSNWLVGGQGTNIVAGHLLYNISETGGVFTGTAITTPAGLTGLTSITAIGYGGGNNWLIGGNGVGQAALLYSYNSATHAFVDLTASMQTETQAAITTINSIVWNGLYWLIGGAGEFNVSPDVGGSVAAPDPDNEGQPGDDAKVAFTGGTVDHDSSVRVSEVSGTAGITSDTTLESIGSTYDFTCQDLLTNSLVTQFDKSVTINLSYDPAQLGDKSESSLTISYYDASSGKWVAVPSTIDTTNKIITATVNHFTQFGVFSNKLPYTGD